MKKRIISMLFVVCLLTALVCAHADSYTGTGTVTYKADGTMESDFTTAALASQVSVMQPGDDITYTITLTNAHTGSTDWYMLNEVLQSLEDTRNNVSGGAYTYRLSYTKANGTETVFFDSRQVGGDIVTTAGAGLNEATTALDEYFYMDTMTNGQTGTVTLYIMLDGETQGNDYQDTFANLRMRFAVEQRTTPNTPPTVPTGDDTNLLPYYIAMVVSGLLFLALAVDSLRRRKKGKEETAA